VDRSHERDADTGLREPFERNDGSRARRTLWRYVRPAATTILVLVALAVAALGTLQLRDWVVSYYLVQLTGTTLTGSATATSVPTGTWAPGAIPAPDYGALVPFGYVVDKTLDIPVGGPSFDHVVVSSDALSANSTKAVDVRIVSWDEASGAWVVALDLAKERVQTAGGGSMSLLPEACRVLTVDLVQSTGQATPALVMTVDMPGAESRCLATVVRHDHDAWRVAYSYRAGDTKSVQGMQWPGFD
jgi:hypothetical protein